MYDFGFRVTGKRARLCLLDVIGREARKTRAMRLDRALFEGEIKINKYNVAEESEGILRRLAVLAGGAACFRF